jgi:hypothetical protein
MILGLPMLYYGFMGYYFVFYLAGKQLLSALVKWKWVESGGKGFHTIAVLWACVTVALILYLGEYVYRLFVPRKP